MNHLQLERKSEKMKHGVIQDRIELNRQKMILEILMLIKKSLNNQDILLIQSIVIDRYEIFLLCLLYQGKAFYESSQCKLIFYEGMSSVHLAASLGRLKMLQNLKLYGAQFDAKDELGMTPLDRAILYNHSEIIEFLKQKQ